MGMMELNLDVNGVCGVLDVMWYYVLMMVYVLYMYVWWLLFFLFLFIDIFIKGLMEFVEQCIVEYRLKVVEFIDDVVFRDDNNFLVKMFFLEK